MNCKNCGHGNMPESKFCVKCGTSLIVSESNGNANETLQSNVQNVQSENQISSIEPNNQNSLEKAEKSIHQVSTLNITEYFSILLNVILKPFTTFKEEIHKLDDLKNSIIWSLLITIVATIITLVKSMYHAVRVTSYNWSSGYTKSWVWENLRNINYIKVIGTNFFIYMIIIMGIAAVYYIGSIILKKKMNFSRFVGISAVSVVPMLLCSLVISPLLSIIYAPLGLGITIIGSVYTIIIIYEAFNGEILLEGNMKLYFNLACMSILAIIGYYLYMKFFAISITNAVSNNVDNILDIFNKIG